MTYLLPTFEPECLGLLKKISTFSYECLCLFLCKIISKEAFLATDRMKTDQIVYYIMTFTTDNDAFCRCLYFNGNVLCTVTACLNFCKCCVSIYGLCFYLPTSRLRFYTVLLYASSMAALTDEKVLVFVINCDTWRIICRRKKAFIHSNKTDDLRHLEHFTLILTDLSWELHDPLTVGEASLCSPEGDYTLQS